MFCGRKASEAGRVSAQLTNAKHKLSMENGEVQEMSWETGTLAVLRAMVAMDGVQTEVYGLLSDIALERAVASTPEGIVVIDKAAGAALDEAGSAEMIETEGEAMDKAELPGVAVYR